MRLFHITDRVYQIGEVVSIDAFYGDTCFYHQKHREHQWINDYLDWYRPAGCPSRKLCIYAFDKPEHCFAYLCDTPVAGYHCYEIEMDAMGGFPMILTGKLNDYRDNDDILKAIAEEYWHPAQKWRFYEYIGKEMTIISEVNIVPIACAFSGYEYMMDNEIAKSLFK